tara:strand:+ start:430 stop:1305 length:876 start_codon:yes stop_codon:yes gene_type:complete
MTLTNNEKMQSNVSKIIDTINNITKGINTNSNQRLELLISIQEAVKNEYFNLRYDLNHKKISKNDYKPDYKQLNNITVTTDVVKYCRNDFQENYLKATWQSANSEDKAKIQALRDSFDAYIPIYLYEKKNNKTETLFKKNKSYFAGANNSLVRVKGEYVFDNLKVLNPTNEDSKSLNFSQLSRVGKGYLKGDPKTENNKTNPFNLKLKAITSTIIKDYQEGEDNGTTVEFFNVGDGDTEALISKLVVACNSWLSELRKHRSAANPEATKQKEIKSIKEDLKNAVNNKKKVS